MNQAGIDCKCGNADCTAASAGLYCLASANTCKARPATRCSIDDGSAPNTAGVDCKCGSADCTTATGRYCAPAANPYQTIDGLRCYCTADRPACAGTRGGGKCFNMVGGESCALQGRGYWGPSCPLPAAVSKTCGARPATTCGVTDGSASSNIDCKCGSVDCTSANGFFCVAERNKCHATALPKKPASVNIRVFADNSLKVNLEPPDVTSGITYYNLMRYISQKKERTWQGGEDECVKLGSTCHLTSIHSAAENQLVRQMVSKDTFVGLKAGTGSGSTPYVFSDGTAVDYEDWAPNEPSDGTQIWCGQWWYYPSAAGVPKWDDVSCTSLRPSICKCTYPITSSGETIQFAGAASALDTYYVSSCKAGTGGCSLEFSADTTTLPGPPKSVSVRVAGDNTLQFLIQLPMNDGGAKITHYNVQRTTSTLVASAWIPSYESSIPANFKSRGQFLTDGNSKLAYDSMTLECSSETTRVHRDLTFSEPLDQLNKAKLVLASTIISGHAQVPYNDELNVPTAFGISQKRTYAEWHAAGSDYRRFIIRVNQVHCLLNYANANVGGQTDNPKLGQWGRIWANKITNQRIDVSGAEAATSSTAFYIDAMTESGFLTHDSYDTATFQSCTTLGCSTTSTVNTTDPPCAADSTLQDGVCWVFLCPAGEFQSGQIDCTRMTNSTCPSGFEFHSATVKSTIHLTGSTFDDGMCTPCAPGKFKSTITASRCLKCPKGYHTNNDTTSLSCSKCPKGTYAQDIGTPACMECVVGKTTKSIGSERKDLCVVCRKGKYAPSPGGLCIDCPAGTYLNDRGQTVNQHDELSDCKNCSLAKYNPYKGQPACVDCPLAKTTGASDCPGCKPGQYNDVASASTSGDDTNCRACPQGYFNQERDLKSCFKCTIGFYSLPKEPFTSCKACARGFYGDVQGAVTSAEGCKECPVGRYSELDGYGITVASSSTVACTGCPRGRWSDKTGVLKESLCVNCQAGFHGSTTEGASGNYSCKECGIGTFSEAVGSFDESATCQECPTGFAQRDTGSTFCLPCIPGTYQAEEGQRICLPCPVGKFVERVRAVKCDSPKFGFVAGNSKAGQIAVGVGWFARCTGEGENKVCDGTDRCPPGTHEKDHACLACPAGKFAGSGATKCSDCDKGKFAKFSSSSACKDCDTSLGLVSKSEGSKACESCPSGKVSLGKSCLEASIDSNLPTLSNVHVTTSVYSATESTTSQERRVSSSQIGRNQSKVFVEWDAFKNTDSLSIVTGVNLELSDNLEFLLSTTTTMRVDMLDASIRTIPGKVEIDLGQTFDSMVKLDASIRFKPLIDKVLYVRIRTLRADGSPGAWSAPNEKWITTEDCLEKSYLDISIFTNRSWDPTEWKCHPCPLGATCTGDITWDGVIATFGYWRVPGVLPNEFVACAFPGACLGAQNPKLEDKYFNETEDGMEDGVDYAKHRLKEGCNTYYGFKPGSRLCHTCGGEFRRFGKNRCAVCPKKTQNGWLLAMAVILLGIALFAVVRMTISDAGTANESEIIRKIMFNFLQVSALASGFPLHWPAPIEALFDFQGAISTAGEHILNPDCSVRGITAADLFYAKQIGYASIPFLLAFSIFLIWRTYGCIAGVPWSDRKTVETHTLKDKMVVTICVLLYFFWPTSLKQAFRMFSCRSIGQADNKWYLMADFEEPCFEGRHLVYALILGGAQILLYAIGLPLLVYVFLRRHRHGLHHPVVKFRYGLFFSGFRTEKYYWECLVAMRKESTVLLSVFGSQVGIAMLAHISLLVLMVQIIFQLIGQPYNRQQLKLQVLDVTSMVICWCTMWSGFFFYEPRPPSQGQALEFLTILVVSVNALYMYVLLHLMCKQVLVEKKDSTIVLAIKKRTPDMSHARDRLASKFSRRHLIPLPPGKKHKEKGSVYLTERQEKGTRQIPAKKNTREPLPSSERWSSNPDLDQLRNIEAAAKRSKEEKNASSKVASGSKKASNGAGNLKQSFKQDTKKMLPVMLVASWMACVSSTCMPGRYVNIGSGVCEICLAGKYSLEEDSSECTSCPVETYTPFSGHDTDCYSCMSAEVKGSKACNGCKLGKYKDTETESCKFCPMGYYSDDLDLESCYGCPTGYYGLTQHPFSSCKTCQRGKYGDVTGAASSIAGCKDCGTGRYSEAEGLAVKTDVFFCQGCPKGRWSNVTGIVKESLCINCDAGLYGSTVKGASDKSSCKKCGKGQYSEAVGAFGEFKTCESCPAGFAQVDPGQAFCLPCVPGTYQAQTGQKTCFDCEEGKYASDISALGCQAPLPGHVPGPSKAGQVEVAAGWFALCTQEGDDKVCNGTRRCRGGTYEKNRVCFNCPSGYSSTEGSIKCEQCGVGTFAASNASPSCQDCDAPNGMYNTMSGSTSCLSCQDGMISTGRECFEAPIDTNLPVLQHIQVVVHSVNKTTNKLNFTTAVVSWDMFRDVVDSASKVATLHIQWSNNLEFPALETDSTRFEYSDEKIRTDNGNILIELGDLFPPLVSTVLYVRVRTMLANGRPGAWSTPNVKWITTRDCLEISYLDISIFTNRSWDPTEWKCHPCPLGATCTGDITWDGVIATFGYWRVPGVLPNEFVACAFPGACLGAQNPKLEDKYFNETEDGMEIGVDYAKHRLKEGCNTFYGFKPGSRLCHTCGGEFRRLGLDRCAVCPKKTHNFWLLAMAVMLLIVGAVGVVWMTIRDAGKAEQSEIIRKIMFNFLQVSALASGFPLHWPAPIEALFDFQGAISTAGEHILNPDCSVRGVDAIDLFYSKQVGYAVIPPGLALLIYIIWRLYSIVFRVPWRLRDVLFDSYTPKDKMVVTICVLLYFFWPTSLKQAFSLFACRLIGERDDQLFLISE